MLILGFLLASPVAFALLIFWGICRRLAPRRKALLNGILGGSILTYLGTCFFLNVPPPALMGWVIQHDPRTLQALNYLGFPSTKQHHFYFGDMLVALAWLFVLGGAASAGLTVLARREPFEPYAS